MQNTQATADNNYYKAKWIWINNTNQRQHLARYGRCVLLYNPTCTYLDSNKANQVPIGALQNQISTAGAKNLTDNTRYANRTASVDHNEQRRKPVA